MTFRDVLVFPLEASYPLHITSRRSIRIVLVKLVFAHAFVFGNALA